MNSELTLSAYLTNRSKSRERGDLRTKNSSATSIISSTESCSCNSIILVFFEDLDSESRTTLRTTRSASDFWETVETRSSPNYNYHSTITKKPSTSTDSPRGTAKQKRKRPVRFYRKHSTLKDYDDVERKDYGVSEPHFESVKFDKWFDMRRYNEHQKQNHLESIISLGVLSSIEI